MNLLLALVTVFLVGIGLGTAAATTLRVHYSAFGIGLSIGSSILLGYLIASAFLFWQPTDRSIKRRVIFPATVAALSVASAFVGLGPLLGWAFSASLVQHHAAMSGWFLGITASTIVVVFAGRAIDGLVSGQRWITATTIREAFAISNEPRSTLTKPLRAATWGLGIVLLLLLMIGHAIAGPFIIRQYGSDASYQSAIASMGRSIFLLVPSTTLIGMVVERQTRNSPNRWRWIILLWVLVVIGCIGELWMTYADARDSESGRWWIEHQTSREYPSG